MQSDSQPLLIQSLPVGKELLKDVPVLASIDRGSTLTKVLYTTELDGGNWLLHLALFENKNFEAALNHLQQQRIHRTTDAGGRLRVTGVGGSCHGDRISELLGLEIDFIDEATSQMAGFHFLVRSFKDSDICYPAPEVQLPTIERTGTIRKMVEEEIKSMGGVAEAEEKKFPCLFAIFGSSAGVAVIHEDGRVEVKHRHLLGGKSFLGLAQLLLGSCSFDEAMELAAAGNRGNVDTQVRDVLQEAPDGPYGQMPPDMPIFAFGKGVDFGKTLSESNREDVAHSLVASFVSNFFAAVVLVAKFEKVSRIYFGGNFYRHELTRKETILSAQMHGKEKALVMKFLKTGHTGAIGAMITEPQAATKFLSSMQLQL